MSERFRLRSSGLEWRLVQGEVIALDLPVETYLGVNRSGTTLWKSLAEGATREELVDTLLGEYEIEHADAGRDVDGFIAVLHARGLLEVDSE